MFEQYAIPLPHLSWLISASISFLISSRVYLSWKKNRSKKIKNFFYLFLFLGIFFYFVSLPALFFKNPNLIQIGYIFSWVFIFFPPYFALQIIFDLGKFIKIKNLTPYLLFVFVSGFLILNFLFFEPAEKKYLENFWYWSEGTNSLIQIMGGGIVGTITLLNGFFFIGEGLKSKNKFIIKKSFLMGSGFVFFFIASLLAYAVFPIFPLSVLFSGGLSAGAIFLIYEGVGYQEKIEKESGKKN